MIKVIGKSIFFMCIISLLECIPLNAKAADNSLSRIGAGTGQVMVVTIKKTTINAGKKESIKNITIQDGLTRPENNVIAGRDIYQLRLFDAGGNILFTKHFDFPAYMTIPPPPPGIPSESGPSIISIDEPEVSLVIPYYPNADSIKIYRFGESIPSDSKDVIEAEVKKNSNNERSSINTLLSPAPSAKGSFNIIIIASGYTSSNIQNFQTRAAAIKNTILSIEPFKNTSTINVNSFSNTTDMGCYIGCYNIDRLMCCDSGKVTSVAAGSGYLYDEIIVIHNTSTYGGGGYQENGDAYKNNSYVSYCMVYDGQYTSQMALHEFGHSFSNLCDEYTYSNEGISYTDCVNCRSVCSDWSVYSNVCQLGCSAKPNYYRPDNSIMISYDYMSFNQASIKATYFPDGLEKRLTYFTGSSTTTTTTVAPTTTTTVATTTTTVESSGGSGGGGGGCFIATAAFGSPMEHHVQILKDFRDSYLLDYKLGQKFINLYYQASPSIAETISKSETLRILTRWFLIPIVGVAYLTINFGIMATLLIITFVILFLISFVWVPKKAGIVVNITDFETKH